MDRKEIGSWVPRLGFAACLVPFGLFVILFRLRRDVYLEQMPPIGVIVLVLWRPWYRLTALILGPMRRFVFEPVAEKLTSTARPDRVAARSRVLGIGGLGSMVFFAPRRRSAAERRRSPRTRVAAERDPRHGRHAARRPSLLLRRGHRDARTSAASRTRNGTAYQGFSHASWTKPATASLLTSTLPSTHNAIAKPSTLSPDLVLISEAMQEAGYTTGGIVSNVNLAESFGFAQGYDDYYYLGPDYIAGAQESSSKLIIYQLVRQIWLGLKPKFSPGVRFNDFYQDSQVVNEVAFDWLDERADERFFLFLHYMDPHDPYFAHPYDGVGVARVSMPEPESRDRRRAAASSTAARSNTSTSNFGKLLAKLEEADVYDDTVIVVVADHGEEFNEHGGFWHGLTLYDEQIHVPLMIKWARHGGEAKRGADSGVARLIDVGPTLLSVAGADVPKGMQGVDLREPYSTRAEKDRQIFSEEDHEGNVLWSLRTEDEKLIVANPGNPRGLPEREYFDVSNDPDELDPLIEPDAAARLEEFADLQRRAAEGEAVAGGEVEMDFAQCERLRMLGYVEDCSHLE